MKLMKCKYNREMNKLKEIVMCKVIEIYVIPQ